LDPFEELSEKLASTFLWSLAILANLQPSWLYSVTMLEMFTNQSTCTLLFATIDGDNYQPNLVNRSMSNPTP